MITDNGLTFNSSWSSSQTITSTVASTSVVDITGAGSGNVPNMIGGWNPSETSGTASSAYLGADIGQGDGIAIPYVAMFVSQAFVSAGGATFQVSLLAAPDNGSGSPGTYTQLYQSLAFSSASLTAGQTLLFQVPPRAISGQPGEALPRFYKLSYTVASSTFSAGTVNAGIVLNPPNGLVNTLYNNNFVSV